MKKMLIVRAGKTLDSIAEKHGDFHECIANKAGLTSENIVLWNAFEDVTFPSLKDICAIVITGSHSMVTDHEPWSVNIIEWLSNLVDLKIPILGICYGNQLLAEAFGGTTGYHPKGIEIGTTEIRLTEAGKTDLLLGILPHKFYAHVIHSQSAIKLPEGAVLLAENDYEPHHAFRLNENIWGVQFHPEFSAEYTSLYVKILKEKLIEDGRDYESILATVQENDFGSQLLKRFWELAQKPSIYFV